MVKQLTSSSFNSVTGELSLTFADATSIEAGKSYLVKVTKGLNLATLPAALTALSAPNPFGGVIISKVAVPTTTDVVDFIPTQGMTEVSGDKYEILFLASDNKLKYPTELPSSIKGFRAYFQLKNEAKNAACAFSIDFGDGEKTGLMPIFIGQTSTDDATYDLQGRHVNNGQSLKKGVYIVNGKKVIIK